MSDIPLDTEALIKDVILTIEKSSKRIAVIVDHSGLVLGTLTDGDIRRGLLSGRGIESLAVEVMNENPALADSDIGDLELMLLMKKANVLSIPIVDKKGKFVQIRHISDLGDWWVTQTSKYSAVVIMAGGEGKRLRPLTADIPKPMLAVAGVPILERQIRSLANAGLKRCFLAVNHLSHMIEDHFSDGSKFGISIDYLREKEKMGTAGALTLLPKLLDGPLLVMNGDLVTMSNFSSLCDYHQEHESQLTVAAIEYKVKIPYGVLHAEGHLLSEIEEKPSQCYFCNAGIYVLEQELLKKIPLCRYDMTDLIRDCLSEKLPVSVFPVHEYWSDVGTMTELDKTRLFFEKIPGNV